VGVQLGWQGSDEQMVIRSIVGLPIVLRLFSICEEIWSLVVVGGTELVCLGLWGVSLLQLMDSWLAG